LDDYTGDLDWVRQNYGGGNWTNAEVGTYSPFLITAANPNGSLYPPEDIQHVSRAAVGQVAARYILAMHDII
jgi:hypothetical protein